MSLKWCIYCLNYDITDIHSRGYRCKVHQRPMALDESCPSFSDALRSDSTVNGAISKIKKRGYDGRPDNSYWYITSTVCKLAGYDENCIFMNAFEDIKKNYLEVTPEGQAFLQSYDIKGLYLSKILLENYKTNPEDTKKVIEEEIIPQLSIFAMAVMKHQYENALYYYQCIMEFIEEYYNAEIPRLKVSYDEYDETGHSFNIENMNKVRTRNVV